MSDTDDWRRRKAEELGLIQTGPAPSRRTQEVPERAPSPSYGVPPASGGDGRGQAMRVMAWLAVMAGIGLAMLFGWWLRGAAVPVDIGRAVANGSTPAPGAAAPIANPPALPKSAPADLTAPPITAAPVRAAAAPVVQPPEPPRRRPVAPRAVGPSFHCRGDIPSVNRLICDNRRLLALDIRMSAAYGRAIANTGATGRRRIEAAQTRFLNRRAQCDTAACLDRVYRGRIAELGRQR